MIVSYLLPNILKLLHSLRYFFQTSIYFTWRRPKKEQKLHIKHVRHVSNSKKLYKQVKARTHDFLIKVIS